MRNFTLILLVSTITSSKYTSALQIRETANDKSFLHLNQRVRKEDSDLLSQRDVANQMYGVAYSLAGIVRDGTESPDFRVQSLANVKRDDDEDFPREMQGALSVATAAEDSKSVSFSFKNLEQN